MNPQAVDRTKGTAVSVFENEEIKVAQQWKSFENVLFVVEKALKLLSTFDLSQKAVYSSTSKKSKNNSQRPYERNCLIRVKSTQIGNTNLMVSF